MTDDQQSDQSSLPVTPPVNQATSPTASDQEQLVSHPPPDNRPDSIDSADSPQISADSVTVPPPTQSAEIKPEPLESPTMSSTLPENISLPSPTVTFGDLLSGNPPPSSSISSPPSPSAPQLDQSVQPAQPPEPLSSLSPQPPTSPASPSVSFGDLIKDIEITPPSIPEAQRPVEQQPIQPSQSQTQTPPQVSPPVPQSPQSSALPSQPIVIEEEVAKEIPVEKVVVKEAIKEIPVVDQAEVEKQTEEKTKEKLMVLRQQARQKKREKKQAILQRIVDIARTRGRINNQEAQKIFRFPQSTLTDYFQELVSQGLLKKEGKGRATYYHL